MKYTQLLMLALRIAAAGQTHGAARKQAAIGIVLAGLAIFEPTWKLSDPAVQDAVAADVQKLYDDVKAAQGKVEPIEPPTHPVTPVTTAPAIAVPSAG